MSSYQNLFIFGPSFLLRDITQTSNDHELFYSLQYYNSKSAVVISAKK